MSQPHRQRSITLVLTVFYAAATSAILILCTGFLYRVMERNLMRNNAHALADEIEVLRALLQERPDDMEALRTEVQSEGAVRRFAQYYCRVLDGQGHEVIATSGMDRLTPSVEFTNTEESVRDHDHALRWKSPTGRWFMLMAARAELRGGHPQHTLQLALDITHDEHALADYRRMLAIVVALAIMASALIGHIIARRGLQPLEDMAERAGNITASKLDERIARAQWPEELAMLAQSFDAMLERLETSFKRLSQFSDDLAHELRTPISALRLEAEVALQKCRTPEEYQRVLTSSLEEYDRLTRMTESLLFIARAENAETALQPATFDAVAAIREVGSFHEAALAEHKIELHIEGAGRLHADAMLFRQLLSNLLTNATAHTSPGGRIDVVIQAHPDSVGIRVRDTGCGIAAEHLPKLFDRFYRVDASRSQKGTGLGLAIVKSIMALHHGRVEIQSQPGKGTEVILTFPNECAAYPAP